MTNKVQNEPLLLDTIYVRYVRILYTVYGYILTRHYCINITTYLQQKEGFACEFV